MCCSVYALCIQCVCSALKCVAVRIVLMVCYGLPYSNVVHCVCNVYVCCSVLQCVAVRIVLMMCY